MPPAAEIAVELGESRAHREPLLDATSRAALRHSLVLCGLVPLTILFATRLPRFLDDPFFGTYALLAISVTATVMYLGFAHYRDPGRMRTLPADPPLVSCLVAVKDERNLVEACIRSIRASSYPSLELIVVDDGSTDGTAELLRQLNQEVEFQLVSFETSGGKTRALTAGFVYANADYLVFTDSDCVLADDAIERAIVALLADGRLGAVSGHARALNADHGVLTRMQDTWYDGQFSVWKAAESVFGAVTCISGPLAAFRREAIEPYLGAWANDTFLGRSFASRPTAS